jgi:crotonobetainyl-CoA:carnitine CoA-transferase CaiB-like acyl-CoA transferase
LDSYDVVAAAVNDAKDITEDPHFIERTLVDLTGSDILGAIKMPGPILHVSSYSGPEYIGVPEIGQHTSEVLSGLLGYTKDRIASLASEGIITGK